jgi:lipopolysaccharide transport system permease protein
VAPFYSFLYQLNPLVGVINGFRWCLLNAATLEPGTLALSFGVNVMLFASGVWHFRKTEKSFADEI